MARLTQERMDELDIFSNDFRSAPWIKAETTRRA